MKTSTLFRFVALMIFAIGLLLYLFFRALPFTTEVAVHQMRGQTDNQVFTLEDGREGVYDGAGNLVTDFNAGSFNFCNPSKEPVCHFFQDTLPWLRWGNTRDDPTTVFERLAAYWIDLKRGLIASFET